MNRDNATCLADEFLASCGPYPQGFEGRGVVICGGGIKYGTCSYVLVRLLRELGCILPIEVWCLNDDEYDPQWVELLRPFDISCVNAQKFLTEYPHPRLGGWELKPYAIKHSRFREVLLLDADNVPVRDPSFLFETPEYRETGTVFWPDPVDFKTRSDSPLWAIFGAEFHDSPDQESGQLVVDKQRTWRALCLCDWYNQNSDFYYRHVYGDKETFRYAWQRLKQPISWPSTLPTGHLPFTLQQYDFDGNVLFQHRFYRKWSLLGENLPVPGFEHEDLCLQYVDELRRDWQPQRHLMRHLTTRDREEMQGLTGSRFVYRRPGHNKWTIRLGPEGRLTEGYGPNEYFWWRENDHLILVGMDGKRKCELQSRPASAWHGRANYHPRMGIHLEEFPA
ncbi:hypothetical protein [Aeoliella sp.]|uniref:hypothetical protein n=1 Tax=Aeoliella sp. TaxID=2795800 RepID=UPI003CCBCBE0